MLARPQREHEWLQQLVGEWTYEAEALMGPDAPPAKTRGTERVHSLGGMWVIAQGEGEMPGGGTGQMVLTLGYDPAKGHYIGTWVGSMMATLWNYRGEMDAGGTTLTLNAEGPSMLTAGATAQYRDVIEVKSRDHRIMTSHMQLEDGTWAKFMTAHYRRTT